MSTGHYIRLLNHRSVPLNQRIHPMFINWIKIKIKIKFSRNKQKNPNKKKYKITLLSEQSGDVGEREDQILDIVK